ncbi:MAG: ComEA family DNA-binding protein [Endozoicomonas sp.]
MKKQIATLFAAAFLIFSTPSFAEKKQKLETVNVNSATVQQLDENLLGVGKKIAQEIVSYREERGPFKSMDDFEKVKYVGSSVIKKNETRIVFE